MCGICKKLVTVHKDSQGAIALAVAPQIRPRTNNIAIKYHYFWSFVANDDIYIQIIDTKEQIVDIFTKPLDYELFGYLLCKLNRW